MHVNADQPDPAGTNSAASSPGASPSGAAAPSAAGERAAPAPVDADIEPLPRAVLRPERRWTWLWFLPVIAAGFAAWLGVQLWQMRGVEISIHFDQGHGLRPGDDVRYRGISIGQVRAIDLDDESGGVVVRAALQPQAADLARAGTRVWIVRPQLGVTGVAGLETVVGPRYLTLSPGDGPPQRSFVGLDEPPIVEAIQPGDLEIILQMAQRGSVRPGTPVTYRQVPVGRVLSTGLSSDGGAVEARVHIEKAYTQLIRAETKFWNIGGLDAQVGLRGMSIGIESLETLFAGGIALATPPGAGPPVRTGHRFPLAARPQEEWLKWEPLVAIGSSLLPAGSALPTPMRAVLAWKEGKWLKSDRARRGWILQTERGVLGPADLLVVADAAERDAATLELAGRQISLSAEPIWTDDRLAIRTERIGGIVWPAAQRRAPQQVEDCVAVADSTAAPLPLAAARLKPEEGAWTIDASVSVDDSWHGACVLSRRDGRLIGMVLVAKDAARVALLPAE